eukprot:CAMPEP_0116977750 /NCGR_PEP_ID=MMETSP0467-20121206/57334_1 /TAXON_ID=283647 /ORGANISM="Mesodinium pulex, Strain SPMC105" /LENGTH=54 /DNA_ID=CAMNT_0004670913 /DNA_START=791 /DNA_END=955 /DNA_ORIENTATION=-
MNKIKPNPMLMSGKQSYEEAYIENYMAVEERVKEQGLQLGRKLEQAMSVPKALF